MGDPAQSTNLMIAAFVVMFVLSGAIQFLIPKRFAILKPILIMMVGFACVLFVYLKLQAPQQQPATDVPAQSSIAPPFQQNIESSSSSAIPSPTELSSSREANEPLVASEKVPIPSQDELAVSETVEESIHQETISPSQSSVTSLPQPNLESSTALIPSSITEPSSAAEATESVSAPEDISVPSELGLPIGLEASLIHAGDDIPPFSVQTLDGDELKIPQLGKIAVINFFATWCGPCRAELPHLESLWKDFQSNEKVQFIVIGRDESNEKIEAFRKEASLTLPFAPDPQRQVFSLFASKYIPRTLIVGPNGKIVHSKVGFDEADIERYRTVIQHQLATLP